jgi:hypothetical protein
MTFNVSCATEGAVTSSIAKGDSAVTSTTSSSGVSTISEIQRLGVRRRAVTSLGDIGDLWKLTDEKHKKDVVP